MSLAKYIWNLMLCIGDRIAAFTDRKPALPDLFADTAVPRGPR